MSSLYAAATVLVLGGIAPWACGGEVTFLVKTDQANSPVSGRLVIGLVDDSIDSLKNTDPNEAPIWDVPQPMFAANVKDLSATAPVSVADVEALNIAGTKDLVGVFRVAARLITTHETSSWRSDAGNLFSEPMNVTFSKDGKQTVELNLTKKTTARAWPADEAKTLDAHLVEIRSTLLSEFHKKDVMLRACVVPPRKVEAGVKYGVVYEVPGFGGRHFDGLHEARRRKGTLEGAAAELADRSYYVTLDPESPNGHTLFADSANNGPCGRALIEELIPAIESQFPAMAATPQGRMLRGHSSGGWSTIWLAITYPNTFGACWSSSPDPIDFRRFQLIDLYSQRSAYQLTEMDSAFNNPLKQSTHAPIDVGDKAIVRVEFGGRPRVLALGSFRTKGKCVMTVEQETRGEDLLGPDNTSGQQWDSWLAVFCPRNERNHPAALFDPATGKINDTLLDSIKAYDIGEKLRANPGPIGQLFRTRIRLIVGTADNFYLNEAVRLFKTDLDRRYPSQAPDKEYGYIEFIEGADHGTIFGSPRMAGFPAEMLAHLRRVGLVETAK